MSRAPVKPTATESQTFLELLLERLDKRLEYAFGAGWVLEWVADNFTPEEIFTPDKLREWAERNDYICEG